MFTSKSKNWLRNIELSSFLYFRFLKSEKTYNLLIATVDCDKVLG